MREDFLKSEEGRGVYYHCDLCCKEEVQPLQCTGVLGKFVACSDFCCKILD